MGWQLTTKRLGGEENNATLESVYGTGCRLYCQDEPAKNSYNDAWPTTFHGAYKGVVLQIGQDMWKMYHWVEIVAPKGKDSAGIPGGKLEGQAIAHLVMTQGGWHRHYPQPTFWHEPRVAHVTAGGLTEDDEDFAVFTGGTKAKPCEATIKFNNMKKQSDPAEIKHNGSVVGWVFVSISVKDFSLRSHAVFVPKSYVKSTTLTLGTNFSLEGPHGGGSAGVSWHQTNGVNQAPDASPILLDWTFTVAESDNGIDEPTDWAPPNPAIIIPSTTIPGPL